MNCELPDDQAGFRKGRGTRDQIANTYWIIEKVREFQKNIYFCFIDYAEASDCVGHNKLWKILKGHPLQYSCLENPHGQRSLAGYSSRSHKELHTTEQLSMHTHKPSGRGVEERPGFGARSLGLSPEPALSCVTLSQSPSPSEPVSPSVKWKSDCLLHRAVAKMDSEVGKSIWHMAELDFPHL